MQSNLALAGPTYVLMAIATLMLQLALYDRQGFVPHESLQLIVVFVIAVVIRRSDRWSNRNTANAVTTIGFVAIAALPFVADVTQRTYSAFGNPFEVQLVLGLRNLMICLGARNRDARSLVFGSLASGFVMLYSFLWLLDRWTIALVFVYAVIGMWWLMGAYWDRLSGCFVSRSERRIPWKPIVGAAALAIVTVLASLPLATGRNFTTAIKGLLPSSGGTGGQDEFAFGGVGDGPQMVSAKDNASGFGPIESELFLESKMPSLYDVINEFSDAKPKPKKKGRQRAIPLAPSQMQENHQRRGINQRAGREFDTVRRKKQETRKLEDLRSRALLQVVGRVPVHLGLYTYDTWDGHKLIASDSIQEAKLGLDLDAEGNKYWATLVGRTPDRSFTHRDRHELRILNLKTDRVPTPPNVTSVHIDKLHTEKLFRTTPDGMLALDMDHIPQLSILHIKSLQRLGVDDPRVFKAKAEAAATDDSLTTMALSWTEGVNEGWPEIEAICDRLRTEYTLDAEAMVPEDADDAAKYFLLESKRGPDYLFATSAALLLRSLGYESRIVSGFYADPKNYERQSRITSVYAEDAHFWVEVLSSAAAGNRRGSAPNAADCWIAVDPTPGFEVLLAPESLWTKLFARAALTWHALKRNPVLALSVAAMLAVAWSRKAYLLDLSVTAWWLLVHRWGDIRYRVTSTVRLLERRARVHGCPRAKGLSLSRWSDDVASLRPTTDDWQGSFVDLANWALYGEGVPNQYSDAEAKALCRQAAATALHSPAGYRMSLAGISRGRG